MFILKDIWEILATQKLNASPIYRNQREVEKGSSKFWSLEILKGD